MTVKNPETIAEDVCWMIDELYNDIINTEDSTHGFPIDDDDDGLDFLFVNHDLVNKHLHKEVKIVTELERSVLLYRIMLEDNWGELEDEFEYSVRHGEKEYMRFRENLNKEVIIEADRWKTLWEAIENGSTDLGENQSNDSGSSCDV